MRVEELSFIYVHQSCMSTVSILLRSLVPRVLKVEAEAGAFVSAAHWLESQFGHGNPDAPLVGFGRRHFIVERAL